MRRSSSTGLAVVLALLSLTPPLASQEGNPKRVLGGHSFVPNPLLGDPFVGTFVRNASGGGNAIGLTVAVPDLDGNVAFTTEADIVFIDLALEYQQNLTNWLAVRIGGNAGARLGSSIESLLAEGATAIYGYNLGLTGQVVRTERFTLAGSLNLVPNKAYLIHPLEFAQSVLENGLDSASSLLTKGSGWRFTVGAHPAWAVTRWLGLVGQIDAGPNQASDEETEEEQTQVTIGLGASVNLQDVNGTPLGFILGYAGQSGRVRGERIAGGSRAVNFGVFYTGVTRFSIGLDVTHSSLDQELANENINLVGAKLHLRYDFR